MAQFESEIELRVRVIDEELNKLEKKINKIRNAEVKLTPQDKQREATSEAILNIEKRTTAELKKQQRIAENAAKRRKENILAGVGFSALFGGGPGEILGGGIGAAAGGLGGSLIGSVLGRSIDQLVVNARDLGNAFTSVDTTLKQLVNTGFDIDRATQKRIQLLADEGRETEAFLLALEKAGVTAEQVRNLQNLDQAFDELQNSLASLGITLASELAPAIVVISNLIKNFVDSIKGPDVQRAAANLDPAAFQAAQTQAATETSQFGVIGNRDEYNRRLTELSQDIVDSAAPEIDTSGLERVNTLTQENLDLIEKRQAAIQAGNDLTNEAAYIAQRQIVFAETRLAVAEALGNREKINLALAREALKLDELRSARADQLAQAGSRAAREAEAAARKEQQVQASLAQLAVQEFQLIGQTLDIGRTRLGQVEAQLNRLNEVKRLQTDAILASTEDSRIQQAKLIILERQTELEREKLKNIQTQLLVQKEIQALQSQQQVEGLSRALGQQLERSSFLPSGNQFADQSELLALDQTQRYENAIAGVNNQIEIQQTLLQKGTADQRAFAEAALPGLQRQQQLYETLLPQIFAAEQAQLKFNQALELVQGPVNAFVGGLTSGLQGIIDGTKSVEEAFADMLKGIADALIQTAAQMIAQWIAVGIAKQFALGPSSNSSPGKINPFVGSGKGFAEGGYVTRPTNALIGEGGEAEYVIPASKMPSAMARYSEGERGGSVIGGYKPKSEWGYPTGGSDPQPTSITINGGITQIGNDEYIRKDQLPSIIDQASKAGETRALSRIRNSPGTRRRLAI